MDVFDPVINYGPNDAGASAFTITAVVIGILLGSWVFGAAYGLLSNYLKGRNNQKGDR